VNCLLLRRGAGIDHGAVPAIFHDAAFNCDAQRVTDRIKPCAEESLAEMDQYEFGSGYGHGKQREFVREYWDLSGQTNRRCGCESIISLKATCKKELLILEQLFFPFMISFLAVSRKRLLPARVRRPISQQHIN